MLRAQERRKPDEITSVNQPFNPNSFNFTKIKAGEVLFELEKQDIPCESCRKGTHKGGAENNHQTEVCLYALGKLDSQRRLSKYTM